MSSLIQLENIVKSYRSTTALNGVDLSVEPGITGLLGPNGAGKSTLIKIILGLIRVTSGSGEVLGCRLYRDGRRIRNKIGYMPEDDCYIPGMSGIEVVQFAGSLSGIPPTEALRRGHEILDFCGVKQERYRNIETYSTGMRQKVKFAAAIVHDPEFLILDEPTSGLDPEEREALLNRIKILSTQNGKSVLLSTHILPDVQQICDRVIILAKGQIKLNDRLEVLNQTVSPTVTVRFEGDHDSFVSSLERARLRATDLNRSNTLKIEGDIEDLTDQVWKAASAANVAIHSLVPARNSLEEIFMQTVQEASVANS
ncbi:ABC transporter ATP-binding protein [Mariniblastus fucicola]|uniref:Putative ABC transporter ATP-binding protein YxlF n=1 Tax=Mariniblastus fucicola TaxID=980251 RepID=A0A5B9PGD0_9BACT|nr:ABC transporter ATP-binding protein [Mariniblastus fucicola]QEG23822.1 putative ABC transporter ATP-binding protein YxlF [Mariniblastus fucicola]